MKLGDNGPRTERSLQKQLKGFRLATAEIIYRRPDFPTLLQSYIWQELDLAPNFPTLKKFLKFWDENLDGPLHSVHVMSASLISPAEFRLVGNQFKLH